MAAHDHHTTAELREKLRESPKTTSWKGLFRLISPFFNSEVKWRARGFLTLLLILLVSIKGFDVIMSYIGRDFIDALEKRNQGEFIHQLLLYLGAFCIAIPLATFYRFTEERLSLFWRGWFSKYILQAYFKNRVFYRLGWYRGIDNPDQRIEEDVRSFTTQSLSLFLIFLQSIIALIAFGHVLAGISTTLTIVAVLYAIVGSLGTYFLGKPLIGLNYEQLKREADYRYKLIKVRDNAEAIALYRSERIESTRVRQRLREAIRNMKRIIRRNFQLNTFTFGYNYFNLILPTIVAAPLYLRGEITFGQVTQSAVAFGHVLNALSVVVQNFGSLSSYAAVVRRLSAFHDALQLLGTNDTLNKDDHFPTIIIKEGPSFAFNHLTLLTPNRTRTLVKDLTITFEGKRVLICGPSGHGKTAIVRAVTGLWTYGSGEILRPELSKFSIVPQRPYLTIGTLRSQILYGQARRGYTDSELLEVIRAVELEEMFKRVGGFNAAVDWSMTLSNGEQQRIGLARAILARSPYTFLDEATTAIDEKSEVKMYEKIHAFSPTIVSVGYRSNLSKYHDIVLELRGDGSWKIE